MTFQFGGNGGGTKPDLTQIMNVLQRSRDRHECANAFSRYVLAICRRDKKRQSGIVFDNDDQFNSNGDDFCYGTCDL